MIRRESGWGQCRFSKSPAALLSRLASISFLTAALVFHPMVSELSAAANTAALEYDIKAAFLLNFTKFVEWPPDEFPAADTLFTICILGEDPFGRSLDQMVEGESVNGHKIAIERWRADQPKSCQVLYIGNGRPVSAVPGAVGNAVLTVGEGADFIHQGGVIAFVLDNRRVRFDINLKAATNAGLKLSSKLLSVARSVEK